MASLNQIMSKYILTIAIVGLCFQAARYIIRNFKIHLNLSTSIHLGLKLLFVFYIGRKILVAMVQCVLWELAALVQT